MTKGYWTSNQDISLDFEFTINLLDLDISEENYESFEEAVVRAITDSNIDGDVDIVGTDIIEGGFIGTEPIEDYFHIIITCTLEMEDDEYGIAEGVDIDRSRLISELTKIPIIGQYINTASIDIHIYAASESNWITYEPDYDSMPGGPDYYDD